MLYVRIDTKCKDEKLKEGVFEAHLSYLQKIAHNNPFLGGGFVGEAGGMIVFEADNLTQAKAICDQDPIIGSGVYAYDLKAWEIVIKSKDVFCHGHGKDI